MSVQVCTAQGMDYLFDKTCQENIDNTGTSMTHLRRAQCARCKRPMSYCVCAHVQAVSNRTDVLILQHLKESKHPLNTARLAVLGLCRAECWTGQTFPELAARLSKAHCPVLLFPGEQAQTPQQWLAQTPKHLPDLLIVPDGTWRQAGQLIRSHPILQTLPRVQLPAGEPSRYRVRRAAGDAAVSTIEAIVRTLSVLEPDTDFQPVLRPFEALIDGQIRAMGEQAFARHQALSAKRAQET